MKSFYLIFVALFIVPFCTQAQDGTLDTSFGSNGTVVETFLEETSEFYGLVKTDDALYAAGFAKPDAHEKIAVAKFDLNGNLDTSFGDNGLVVLDIGSGNGRATTLLQDADGKLVAAGWTRFGNKDQYVVARMELDGSLDATFGDAGIATGSFSGSSFAEDEIADAKFLSDGKIIVVGRSYNGLSDDGFVGCLNADGTLNTDFGDNGEVIIDFDGGPPSEDANAVVITDNDDIIIGGTVSLEFNEERSMYLMKMDANGVTDANFGNNGSIIYTINANTKAGLNALALDNQGRILTGGGAFDTDELDNNFFVTRYSAAGVLDNTFGDNGAVILQRSSNESIFDLHVRSNGDILAAGSTGGFGSSFAIVRLGGGTGTQDMTFGNNGWATTQIESTFSGIKSIVVDNEGIYAAGFGYDGDLYKSALAKYINEGMATSAGQVFTASADFSVFPNPIQSDFSVEFDLLENMNLRIDLMDVNGRKVMELLPFQNLKQGLQRLNFTVPANLPTGNYWLSLTSNNGVLSKNIVFVGS